MQLQAMKLGLRVEAIAEARSRIYTADATVESAQAQLNLFTLKSPIAGVLDSLNCRLGQTLSPGTSVGEIVDARELMVVVWLPARVCKGQSRPGRRSFGRFSGSCSGSQGGRRR